MGPRREWHVRVRGQTVSFAAGRDQRRPRSRWPSPGPTTRGDGRGHGHRRRGVELHRLPGSRQQPARGEPCPRRRPGHHPVPPRRDPGHRPCCNRSRPSSATTAPRLTYGTPTPAVFVGPAPLFIPIVNNYVYAWRTNRLWMGTCATFTLTLDDATVHTADFRFT